MYAEIKYDGERVQVHKQGDKFEYFSRSLKPVQSHKVCTVHSTIPRVHNIKERKAVSNAPIPCVECMRRVTHLECQ